MSIESIDDWIASAKQIVVYNKTTVLSVATNQWSSMFHIAGNPGPGTLAGASAAVGVVPTSANAGYPSLATFGASAKGYISGIDYGSTVPGRLALYDRLFVCGPYNFNTNTTLTGQPSFSSRVPGGTDYNGLELWLEQITLGTGVQDVTINYDNQAGVTKSIGPFATASSANSVARAVQIPLAPGDTGISKINSVIGTVASAGTFNIMILRPLWSSRVRAVNDGDTHDMFKVGLPEIYQTTALYLIVCPDGGSTGLPDTAITVVNG